MIKLFYYQWKYKEHKEYSILDTHSKQRYETNTADIEKLKRVIN
jgi:hypothetical protein